MAVIMYEAEKMLRIVNKGKMDLEYLEIGIRNKISTIPESKKLLEVRNKTIDFRYI